jgi:hypothetical protein
MAQPVKDRVGMVFGRLTVVAPFRIPGGATLWDCRCECGNTTRVAGSNLDSGSTKSCGCLRKTRQGGRATKRIRKGETRLSYESMLNRCFNPRENNYPNYGGRGITVCQRWLDSYDAFVVDMGERPLGTTIDRIDVNGNYEPGNCRWSTPRAQAENRRNARILTAFGKTQSLKRFAEEYNVAPGTLATRLYRGMGVEEALTMPAYDNLRSPKMKETYRNRKSTRYLTAFGKTMSLVEWAEEYNINPQAIAKRLKKGMTPEDAISSPSVPRSERYKLRKERNQPRQFNVT